MLGRLLKAIFGSQNERILKGYKSTVEKINSLEESIKTLSDAQLKSKTVEFKNRLKEGISSPADLLAEAFAVVREASIRTLGLRHFDVQLIGGMVLFEGKIVEMKTGEGKTLVATLPAYLEALSGGGVHIITVNDYLAKRDAEWMGPIYEFLGLRVGVVQHNLKGSERRAAYEADITYGTNNEFGFDYLRDNMVEHELGQAQRGHNYAIIDEVDSILIDESRTPLIISGPAEESTELYYKIDKIIPRLKAAAKGEDGKWLPGSGDYQHEEKDKNVVLSEDGNAKVEKLLGVDNLYGNKNIALVHHVNQALKAHIVFKRDVDYIIDAGKVVIIDEHTGRKMEGRRYSDGLHQALEAKERVTIEQESQTLASITFQNYFRMYNKLAGMTGTAETEAEEFYKIYKLGVVVIPSNKPIRRIDNPDKIYRTEKEKVAAIVQEIKECHKKGQPVLAGTISIEKNEQLSKALKREGIPHNILNAKFHDMEANVVAYGGQRSAVTIATNMAGRGTDIKLGEGVLEAGGLHIIGTERHEARRIDNQLRGRSGRQGDVGSSRFYLSLEDDLMRLFGSGRIGSLMQRMGMTEGQEIEHPWITKAIANAQKKVEARNFEIRKYLLEYDDVMNSQRQYIYRLRKKVLRKDNLHNEILSMLKSLIDNTVSSFDSKILIEEDILYLISWTKNKFNIEIDEDDILKSPKKEELIDYLKKRIEEGYKERQKSLGDETMSELEQYIMLYAIDSKWKDHLYNMDTMKEGIHLRAYAERNPLTEYKLEGSALFKDLKMLIIEEALEFMFKVEVTQKIVDEDIIDKELDSAFVPLHQSVEQFSGQDIFKQSSKQATLTKQNTMTTTIKKNTKIGRNSPCICGSGKKYKNCCGK